MNIVSTACLALLVSFAIAAPGANAQAGASEDVLLRIDAGRLDAMLDQVSLLLKAEDTDDASAGDDFAAALPFTIKRYNRLLGLACGKGVLAGPPCGEGYAPRLSPVPVSDRVLREEIDDAASHIYPFWQAVCAKLDDRAHAVCQME